MGDPNNNNNSNNQQVDTLELDPADGQQYINELREKLLELISYQQTIEDVEDRMRKLYPQSQVINLALKGAREARKSRTDTLKPHKIRNHSSSSSSASFTGALHNITSFAVTKLSNLVKSENEVDKFKLAVIEFIIADVLRLAGGFVKRQKNFIITRSDIRTAMYADKDLVDIFLSDDKSLLLTGNHPIFASISSTDKSSDQGYKKNLHQNMGYRRKVRGMIDAENLFARGLKLIIQVFKAPLKHESFHHVARDVEILFCNVEELLELSTLLLTAFEEALESAGQSEDEIPYVGAEILDLAQAEEFQSYFVFARQRLSSKGPWRKAYHNIVDNESIMNSLKTGGQNFDLAVKHLLPNFLLNTIVHFFEYYGNFSDLYELGKRTRNQQDQLALKETLSILLKTKKAIEALLEVELDITTKDIEPLDTKTAEFLRRELERRLDAEIQHERNLPLPFMPPPEIYRFSEPDTKDNIIFEDPINQRTGSLFKDSENINNNISLNGKQNLHSHPQQYHQNHHQQQPIRNETEQIPVIKSATLIKLVERLTYHKYQPNIVDSFLTTYRAFISDPEELLDLLIERYNIPDPPLSVVFPKFVGSPEDLPESDCLAYRHYLRRFRQEYSKPVKMRVINVLKSWIKNHYYDFERHSGLLEKLDLFLDEIHNSDKVLGSLIKSIKKLISQKQTSRCDDFEFMLSKQPPPILWGEVKEHEANKFDIMTIHPVEFARQLTLVEFDLFRAIRPSELINVRDFYLKTKKKDDNYESSPNLSRMTRHFTLFSYWVRKCIVEMEDFDKRSAIYGRAIEIMGILRELNNFTGLLSIGSAIESAPIARLSRTIKTLTNPTAKILSDYRELNDHHMKKLQWELRQCNPPCIPYLGSYQTKLIHAKEGNKTFIDEVDTVSPTLSNDEFQSLSTSPATPISPVTPMPRSSLGHHHQQQQFFGSNLSTLVASNGSSMINQNQRLSGLPIVMTLPRVHVRATSGGDLLSSSGSSNNDLNNCSPLSPNPPQFSNNTVPFSPSATLTPSTPKMINFTKQRIRAGLVAEIGNYQNLPYCLEVQPQIRHFIESIEHQMASFATSLGPKLDPSANPSEQVQDTSVPAMTKRLDDYLFEQSERIEPRSLPKANRSRFVRMFN